MHLCMASSIRAMPEKEKPPAMRVDLYLLTRYEIKGYNIHVIGKPLVLSVHRTCLLKVLVICLRAGFVRSKQCSFLELVS